MRGQCANTGPAIDTTEDGIDMDQGTLFEYATKYAVCARCNKVFTGRKRKYCTDGCRKDPAAARAHARAAYAKGEPKPGTTFCRECGIHREAWTLRRASYVGVSLQLCWRCYNEYTRHKQREQRRRSTPVRYADCNTCHALYVYPRRNGTNAWGECRTCTKARKPMTNANPRRKVKAAHHKGSHHVRSRHVRTLAYANPSTQCWRCGRTLAEHGPKAKWTAGHVVDGQIGGELRPEASSCNYAAGSRLLNERNNPTLSPIWR